MKVIKAYQSYDGIKYFSKKECLACDKEYALRLKQKICKHEFVFSNTTHHSDYETWTSIYGRCRLCEYTRRS